MKRVDIHEATEQELRDFGRDSLGLNLPPNCKIETLRAKISAAWDKPYINVGEPETQAPQEGRAPLAVSDAQQAPEEGYVRVIISVTEEAGGSDPVPVGVNGKVMLIPRGKEVDIPDHYFEVLQNAISHKYDPLPDGRGLNPIPREVPLYPHQRIA